MGTKLLGIIVGICFLVVERLQAWLRQWRHALCFMFFLTVDCRFFNGEIGGIQQEGF